MKKIIALAFVLLSGAAYAAEPTPEQQQAQQQAAIDALAGRVNREVATLGSAVMQQSAQMAALQAELATTKAELEKAKAAAAPKP